MDTLAGPDNMMEHRIVRRKGIPKMSETKAVRNVYEMRVYHCCAGGMPLLLKRFETDTCRLFEKHGIKPVGFWRVAIGGSNADLIYMLQWESLSDREKRSKAFNEDPEWIEALARHRAAHGQVVASVTNSILTPTSFSLLQ